MNENISVISSRNPKERIFLLINILYLYGIKENKKIYMQSFLLHTSYYVNRLISYISKIDFKIIESYMFPVSNKNNTLKYKNINMKDFTFALKKIKESNIVIKDSKILDEQDWIDYIFNLNNEYQVIIIDNFECLLKNTKNSFKEIKIKIEKYSKKYNTNVILFINEKELTKYKFNNWKVSNINSPFTFTFNKNNNHLLDINLKEK